MTDKIKKIFVVDDDPGMLRLTCIFLKEEGYDVETSNGFDAFTERAESVNPDVVLLDIMMPEKSGYDTCKWIRKNRILKHTKVFMYTALPESEVEKKAKDAGADGVIYKDSGIDNIKIQFEKLNG